MLAIRCLWMAELHGDEQTNGATDNRFAIQCSPNIVVVLIYCSAKSTAREWNYTVKKIRATLFKLNSK